MFEEVVGDAFLDELQKIAHIRNDDSLMKIAMSSSMGRVAGKMFGGGNAASKLRGVGLSKIMKSKVPTKVPRPHQMKGKLAPPARAPRPNPRAASPSKMAPPPPRQGNKSLFAPPPGKSPFDPR